MNELADTVRARAGNRCEYCRLPQRAFRRPFHVEHIVARQHGGRSTLDNLALACWNCNLKKGPNIAGIDPETGLVTALFHPRKHEWTDHFRIEFPAGRQDRIEIFGLTASGRATARVLDFNDEMRQLLRYALWSEGLYVFRD